MTHYTTGEVAKMLKVSQQKVISWCDTGRLKACLIPDSRFRRVTASDLLAFLNQHPAWYEMVKPTLPPELTREQQPAEVPVYPVLVAWLDGVISEADALKLTGLTAAGLRMRRDAACDGVTAALRELTRGET